MYVFNGIILFSKVSIMESYLFFVCCFRIDGEECCFGFFLNRIIGECESKDLN